MFGIDWSEMLVILVIAVVVIGPKDIPKIMYQMGRVARRLQYAKFAMSQQFDQILKAGDIEELRRGVNFEARNYNEAEADEEAPEIKPLENPKNHEGSYHPPSELDDAPHASEMTKEGK
jgi:sec-independent protein translocase protein TatB